MRFNNKNVILPEPIADDRLRLVALEDNSTIGLLYKSRYYSVVQYSLDGSNWVDFTTSSSITLSNNQKLFLRGKQTSDIPLSTGAMNTITLTGKFSVEGNIMHLYDYEHPESTTLSYNYSFLNLFNANTALTYAHKLILPATTLSNGCYTNMFNGSYALLTTPELPATTLSDECYQNMFNGTAITEAPILRATTLTTKCYRQMFAHCSSINKVVSYGQNISASNALQNWFDDVSSTGDFYNLGGASYPSGASGIPSGWTVHTSL